MKSWKYLWQWHICRVKTGENTSLSCSLKLQMKTYHLNLLLFLLLWALELVRTVLACWTFTEPALSLQKQRSQMELNWNMTIISVVQRNICNIKMLLVTQPLYGPCQPPTSLISTLNHPKATSPSWLETRDVRRNGSVKSVAPRSKYSIILTTCVWKLRYSLTECAATLFLSMYNPLWIK